MLTEVIDLYTIDREKTNETLVRGVNLPNGRYRLVAHVCIFNSKNQMLIQQKATLKNRTNIWDLSAGGSVISGENSRCGIRRELEEELGIEYDFVNEKPSLTVYFKDCIDDIYILRNVDVDIARLSLQEIEVKNVRWADKEQIFLMIDQGIFTQFDKSYIELLFFMNRNGAGCIVNK